MQTHHTSHITWATMFRCYANTNPGLTCDVNRSGALDRFGSDAWRIDAVAVAATFGQLCTQGWEKCTNFNAEEAALVYHNITLNQVPAEHLRSLVCA
eukprot:5047149-Pyramimonas_sp.AAC.1